MSALADALRALVPFAARFNPSPARDVLRKHASCARCGGDGKYVTDDDKACEECSGAGAGWTQASVDAAIAKLEAPPGRPTYRDLPPDLQAVWTATYAAAVGGIASRESYVDLTPPSIGEMAITDAWEAVRRASSEPSPVTRKLTAEDVYKSITGDMRWPIENRGLRLERQSTLIQTTIVDLTNRLNAIIGAGEPSRA